MSLKDLVLQPAFIRSGTWMGRFILDRRCAARGSHCNSQLGLASVGWADGAEIRWHQATSPGSSIAKGLHHLTRGQRRHDSLPRL
jgi:hypothetical protein